MRILQVCSAETIGGGERHVIDLTMALIERGHELHLAIRPGSPLRRALDGWPVTFHELPLRNSLDPVSLGRLVWLLRRERIEVLQAHVGRDYLICGLAARLTPGVRFLLTRHHFNPFRGASLLYAWAIGSATALIAVSETVRTQLVAAFPTLADRIQIIPNWIDTRPERLLPRDVARRQLGLTRPFAIAILGQISPLKGQDLFIAAATALCQHPSGRELEFLLIGTPGEGDHEFARQLRRQVDNAGWSGQIHFTGFVENLPAHLTAIDIVAILSENEAFSLVLVESMFAGAAVVATPVGGVAEILEHDRTGLFIERTPAALAHAILQLHDDPALRQRLAGAARLAVTRFDRQRIIDQIEALFKAAHPQPVRPGRG